MIRAVIVEDEYSSKELLKTFLREYCEGVEVVGESETIVSAVEIIKEEKPNIIFLDIELKDGSGFDVLSKIDSTNLLIVFLTGFKQYGIKAIKNNAFDYLLKPLIISNLIEVIDRAKDRLKEIKLLNDIKNIEKVQVDSSKLIIKEDNKAVVIHIHDIVYVKAYGNYSKIFLIDESSYTVPLTVTYYENSLSPIFYRVHKSFLINLNYVASWKAKRTGAITMQNEIQIPLSSRKKNQFIMKVSKFLHDKSLN